MTMIHPYHRPVRKLLWYLMATAPKGVVRRQILAYVEKRDAPPTEANPSQFIVESVVV
jgi:hypothetical protein